MTSNNAPSIHALEPLEQGGSVARKGFDFQDHVAVSFLVEMLHDPNLHAVWCETMDDITLIRAGNVVEFVQVKAHHLNQLWSRAKLIESIDGKKSILEKSLEQDRGSETPIFRIVTSRPVNKELEVLTYPLDNQVRKLQKSEFRGLLKKIAAKVKSCSVNNRGVAYWLCCTFWEFHDDTKAIQDRALHELERWLEGQNFQLLQDQRQKLYGFLLKWVYDAGNEPWKPYPEKKKILREKLLSRITLNVEEILAASLDNPAKTIKHKGERAKLTSSAIQAGIQKQRDYRKYYRKASYREKKCKNELELIKKANALLTLLKSQLDANILMENGPQFHAHCLEELSVLVNTDADLPVGFEYILQGSMYEMASRCQHEFVVVEP